MKYLGIDVGSKRVGISISDDDGKVAFPFSEVSRGKCIEEILRLSEEKKIDGVVFGESVDLKGKENSIMSDVKEISNEVRKKVKVFLYPEQFSTQAASRLGKGSDAEAATIILQGFLDLSLEGEDEEIYFD